VCARRQFKKKKEVLAKQTKEEVMEKYGTVAAKAEEDVLLLGQTERYVEYDRSGRVIKGQDVKARSRYEEDVLNNNHTAVWGSWWHDGTWGYACCHSLVKNSYCTGAAEGGLRAGLRVLV
jgi:pre-mRNA-processing factor SLU7